MLGANRPLRSCSLVSGGTFNVPALWMILFLFCCLASWSQIMSSVNVIIIFYKAQ